MSLDVSLVVADPVKRTVGTGIFIRDGGKTYEMTPEEVKQKWPDWEPQESIGDEYETDEVFDANITHNMGPMARAAGLYYPLWRPDEIGLTKASELIPLLEAGLKVLNIEKEKLEEEHNPDNGWGDWDGLYNFTKNYLEACRQWPKAKIEVSR